jgi:hypothetical protein
VSNNVSVLVPAVIEPPRFNQFGCNKFVLYWTMYPTFANVAQVNDMPFVAVATEENDGGGTGVTLTSSNPK